MITQSDLKVLSVAKAKCLSSLLFHTRYFFKAQYKRKFIIGQHHDAICEALERVLSGSCKRLIINVAPRYGKAIDCETDMFTSDGWKKAREISIGDNLIGSDGNPTKVIGVYPQGETESYRVTFSDGTSLVTCGNHLWSLKNRNKERHGINDFSLIKTTKSLIGKLHAPDGHKLWRIPVNPKLKGIEKILLIDPYLLGCWLGDGHTHTASITTMDAEIINRFSEYDPVVRTHQNSGKALTYGLRNGFVTQLKSLGVFKNKSIPFDYMSASYEQRLELLRGLCDTDGTCNRKNGQTSYCSTNENLYNDVKALIASLGAYYTEYRNQIFFRIDVCPFRLKRKSIHWSAPNKRHFSKRYIASIEKVESRQTVCFTVNAKDSLFCAGRDLIVTHNTELAVKSFISHGLALNPAAKFIHLSYADSLALDNSESIKDLIESEEYQQLFPDVQIKKSSRAKDKWYTTQGGGVLARAAAGQVTGFGAGKVDEEDDFEEFINGIESKELDNLSRKFQFNGAIIIDDPIKPEDADGDTIREKVNSRFDSTIRNRTNSRNTPIIVIMQRLHPMDLSGYLQREGESDEWEVLSLPCIYFDEEGTRQALWPFKETLEELDRQRIANDVVFERQKQQNPKPKAGLLFPEQDLHFFNADEVDLSDPDFKYLPADPANEGGDDFAALDTRLIGDKIYVHDVLYNTEGTDHNEAAIVQMILNERIMHAGIEGVFGWTETVNRIRAELQEKGYEGEVRSLRPRTGKHARITTRAAFIRNHFYFRKDYAEFPQYAKFMRNLTSYLKIQEAGKKNKHDEAPDVCEMAAAYYERNFSHLW